MKTYKDIITEMTSDEYKADASAAVDYFNSEMSKLFGSDFTFKATLGKGITYRFSDAYWKVTRHNATILFDFMMHLYDGFGRNVDLDKFPIEKLATRSNGIKYRKINGKSPLESTKKLVMWFKKNKTEIESTLAEK